ncbi:hypothetical protein ACOMHN_044495 [Nucella lapillus]
MTTSSFLLLIWNVHLNKEAKNSIQNQNIFSKRGNRKDKAVDSEQIFTDDPEKRNNKRQVIQRKHILEENSNQRLYVHSSVQKQQNLTNLLKKTSEEDSASRKRSSMAGAEAKNISLKSGQQQNHLIVVHDRPWFIHSTAADFSTCEYRSCRLSYNLSLLPVARAVVFDAVSLSSGPPKHRPPDQLWVLFVMEPPPRLRFHNPYFQRPEWRDVFNLTMSYRYDSDIFSPYGRHIPESSSPSPRPEFLQMAHRKTRSAVWLVSHCQADSARDQYVRRLQRHLDVDVYGKCSGRKCGNNEECGRLINSTYRFLLAFENSFCKDYVTEKVFNAYSDDLHVIPIVRGGAVYSRILPPGTYVNTSDFPSPEALATFLIGLSKDHVTYARMLERKNM